MEKFKTYAMATVVASSIAVSGVSYTPTKSHIQEISRWQTDTLSTEQFIKQLSTTSAREINLSKLAKKKSKNSKIKEYAIKAMDASILIYADLKPFAEARNVTLTDSATFAPDRHITTLKKAVSHNFDRRYLDITLENHNKAIDLLEKGTKFGDTAIVSFANKQLLIFRRNLEEANFLSKQISGNKTAADGPEKKR